MKILSWTELVGQENAVEGPVCLTIGSFDGLHIGHRKLMTSVVQESKSATPMVITFRKSPALLLAPATFPGFIHSYRQKVALLERLGVSTAVVIDFSEEMSKLSGTTFIGLLKERLRIEKIVVGHNFRFGKDRNAGTDELMQMLSNTGTEVQITEPVLWGDRIVSSSRIRKTIKDADFQEAGAMLAESYVLDLRDIPVRHRGGCLRIAAGRMTQVLPKAGRYQVLCRGSSGGDCPGELVIERDELILSMGDRSDMRDTTDIVFK